MTSLLLQLAYFYLCTHLVNLPLLFRWFLTDKFGSFSVLSFGLFFVFFASVILGVMYYIAEEKGLFSGYVVQHVF
eukprot:UN02996